MKTLASRILPGNIEVRGHVESREIGTKALNFFCERFKKESSADAVDDTEEEFDVDVRIKKKSKDFKEQPIKVYDVYIGPKEHS